MVKRMLIDATRPEETRVAVVNGSRLEEFDYETEFRKQLKGNIYLAKITRVEPSLQAAFIEYGGNRHAFLPFPEIHQDYFRIPMSDRSHLDEDEDRQDGSQPASHHHEDDEAEPSPESALSGERAIPLQADYETNVISQAFDAVRAEEPEENPADAVPAESMPEASGHDPFASDTPHREDEDNAEQSTDYDSSRQNDPFGDEDHESGQGHNDHTPEADEQGSGELHSHGTASGELQAGDGEEHSVETVGGDEVDEIRHRRRAMMPRYKIQEVIKRRQIMLIQVSKEERGNKGAAVTTFLSLPGRYCVLMPNTPRGGGISRKIANPQDRKRLKELLGDLDLPDGMSVILRTAGVERTKAEIKRDLDYLMRLWEAIRDLTLRSTAPAMVYEEGNLIKRSIRDIYGRDIDELIVAGEEGYRQARDFMRMLMPSHAKRVQLYREQVPVFLRHQVESQIDAVHNPVAQLRSGGYVVINQTEALVSIDVNSGRSTRERNIEETAYKTNLEAADEIARQLRLRDMGGLVVIDFIDMEDPRHDGHVERRLKEAMKNDRARIQIGRMSAFGLLELSRQRLHPSLLETSFHTCAMCRGTGLVRSTESASFMSLRAIEEEAIKGRAAEIVFHVPTPVALYILNHQRGVLNTIEQRYAVRIIVAADDSLISPDFRIDRVRMHPPGFTPPVFQQPLPPVDMEDGEDEEERSDEEESGESESQAGSVDGESPQERGRRRRRRRGRRKGQFGEGMEGAGDEGAPDEISDTDAAEIDQPDAAFPPEAMEVPASAEGDESQPDRLRRRRRGRRGGRRPNERDQLLPADEAQQADQPDTEFRAEDSSTLETPESEAAVRPSTAEPVVPEEPVASEGPSPAHPDESGRQDGEESQEPAASTEIPLPQAEEAMPDAPAPKEFETVNQEPETPRQGWWKRLIQ